eukprot:4383682-Heterocapsa_arctica.AAC.1
MAGGHGGPRGNGICRNGLCSSAEPESGPQRNTHTHVHGMTCVQSEQAEPGGEQQQQNDTS